MESTPQTDRTIFKSLNAVQTELSKVGIGKNQKNEYDRYQYRGIDDVLNTLGPILSKHGVLIIPHVVERQVDQVQTQKGGLMNHATLTVDYHFYDINGDNIVHQVVGEAVDRGDKSLNKALTAAYKYLVFQAFCIPLVGDDPDGESHQLADQQPVEKTITKQQQVALQKLIDETSTEVTKFCQHIAGVASLDKIPSSQAQRARKALQDKARKLKQSEKVETENV